MDAEDRGERMGVWNPGIPEQTASGAGVLGRHSDVLAE